MANLFDYDETEAPQFKMVEPVRRHDGTVVGWIGTLKNRAEMGYLSRRDPEEHKFHKLNAYALSVDIIDSLTVRGIERVLIAETTGDVYEYALKQFEGGTVLQYDDLQRCVPISRAEYSWIGLTPEILP